MEATVDCLVCSGMLKMFSRSAFNWSRKPFRERKAAWDSDPFKVCPCWMAPIFLAAAVMRSRTVWGVI